ncbi:MAG: sugar phosphate isomerase/epimerase [Armatimonadetes bacterium]|nr:sugar phosphate isomerase/epimerase [Armatimonadota bacterium]
MKIGITQLVCGSREPLETVLPKVRAAGYDCLEILLTDNGDFTMDSGPDDYRRMWELGEQHGVELVSICKSMSYPGSLASGKPEDAEQFNKTTKKMVECAAALGMDGVLVIPGGPSPDVRYDVAYERNLEGMRKLAPMAEEHRVVLAIEYVWNMMWLSPMEMRRFLDEVGSEYVGFYFDPGNMAIFSYPEQWVEIVGPHVKKVHFKDWSRKNRDWPPLLEGDVDWPRLMQAIRSVGYDGPVVSEVSGDWEQHARTAEAMRKIVKM